jgi:hypothetical protein
LIIVASIVTAFARPYIPSSPNEKVVTSENAPVVVYIDNSFSMSNTGTYGNLLEEAKKYMFDILNSYPAGTGFVLITNETEYTPVLTKNEISNSIAGIQLSPKSKMLSEIFKETKELANLQNVTLFVISDFQRYACDFTKITSDSLINPVFLLIQPENKNNIFIKNVSFEQSSLHRINRSDQISITLGNSADRDFTNVPITLSINDKKKSIEKANLSANHDKTVNINYLNTDAGFYKGEVEITDLPVIFDNKFYFSYSIIEKINVLCLEQEKHNSFFGKLFSDTADFNMTYSNISAISNLQFGNYNLIILDRLTSLASGVVSELENYVNAGGNILVVPDVIKSVVDVNKLLAKLQMPTYLNVDTTMIIAAIETQSYLFKNVFEKDDKNVVLPYAKRYYRLSGSSVNTETVLTDKKGNTVFADGKFGNGKIYISTFDFSSENSDIVYHPIFVPLMVNMAFNVQSELKINYTLGSDEPVVVDGKKIMENEKLYIKKYNTDFEFIPELRRDFNGNYLLINSQEIGNAGIYEVYQQNKIVAVLAFNYNRNESELTYFTEKDIIQHFPNARVENIKTTQISRNSKLVKEIVLKDKNRYLSWWLLLLAILTLFAEQFVWKRKLN